MAFRRWKEPIASSHEYNLFMIGKTGYGKSATANSIIGKKTFLESSDTCSVTDKLQYEFCYSKLGCIKVVDAPGLADTNLNKAEDKKQLVRRLEEAIFLTEGYHAFLLVFRFGQRWTGEDVQVIEVLKEILGPDFVKNFCIIVVTHGDNFREKEKRKELPPFDEWCKAQAGPFKTCYEECNRRAVLFNNMTKDKKKRKEQLRMLLKKVDSLGANRYTFDNFKAAKENRRLKTAGEKIESDLNIIAQKIEKREKLEERDRLEALLELSNRLKDVQFDFNLLVKGEEDDGENAKKFKNLKITLELLRKQLDSKINYCKLYLANRKEALKQEEAFKEREEQIKKEVEESLSAEKKSVSTLAFDLGQGVLRDYNPLNYAFNWVRGAAGC